MSKRPAGEPLETLELKQEQPLTPKRARVDDTDDGESYPPPPPEKGEDADEEGEHSAYAAFVKDSHQVPAEGFSDLYLDTIAR
jgi:hypothetical protein